MSFQQKKRNCCVLTTLASCTWLSFLWKREPPHFCVPCNESLSLEHGLLYYSDLIDVSNSLILIFGGCCFQRYFCGLHRLLHCPLHTHSTLQHTQLHHTPCNTHTATHTNAPHTLQHTHCNTHKCTTHTATHTLQHTHCNTHKCTTHTATHTHFVLKRCFRMFQMIQCVLCKSVQKRSDTRPEVTPDHGNHFLNSWEKESSMNEREKERKSSMNERERKREKK